MLTKIKGKKYDFEVFMGSEKYQSGCFYIRAICVSSRRTSCINNLNAILSEFDLRGDDPTYRDTAWMVSKHEALCFVNITKQILADQFFVTYLEKQLDEDRKCSEWGQIPDRSVLLRFASLSPVISNNYLK